MKPEMTFGGGLGEAVKLFYEAGYLSMGVLLVLIVMSGLSWQSMAWTNSMHRRIFGTKGGVDVPLPVGLIEDLRTIATEADRQYDLLTVKVRRSDWIMQAMERRTKAIVYRLGSRQSLLATVGATSPFIGLLGTVIGIQRALTTIGSKTNLSIADLAGPVGEALIMTAIGLVVAIPAVLGHNFVQRRNAVQAERLGRAVRTIGEKLLAGR